MHAHAVALNSPRMFTPDAGSPAASPPEIQKGSDSFKSITSPMPFEKIQASWLQDALVDTFEVMGKHVESRFTKGKAQVNDDGAGIEDLELAAISAQKAEQAKFKAADAVRSIPNFASYEQRSFGNSGWNTAPTLLERAHHGLKESGIDASQKPGPTTASIPAGDVTPGTWKQSAGRAHGRDGYELGDLTRAWMCRASKTLQEGFGISYQMQKTQDGSAAFMSRASCLPASMDSNSHMPSSIQNVQDEDAIHQDILAKMVVSRTTAKRLLKKSLPLLELRLQELNAGQVLDTQDKYDLYRIHAANLLLQDPLQKYRKCLESVRSHCDIVFDSKFVREAQKTGVLQEFLELLDGNMMLADQCASLVNEVCEGVSIIC